MSLARTLLLTASDSRWLRENGTKMPFVRRAVSTFMPGETPADMLAAAQAQAGLGVGALFKADLVEWMTCMTYQAASGAGAASMKELVQQMGHLGAVAKPAALQVPFTANPTSIAAPVGVGPLPWFLTVHLKIPFA